MAGKSHRVIADTVIEGITYKCNDVVILEENLAKAHKDSLDGEKAAVDYCTKELEAKPIDHAAAKKKAEKAAKPEEEDKAE